MRSLFAILMMLNITLLQASMRDRVLAELEGSWCSKAKANLIMDLIQEHKPQVCVEIGAFDGSTLLPIAVALKANKLGILHAVDAWSADEAIKGLPSHDVNYKWWRTLDMHAIKRTCLARVKRWTLSKQCRLIHKTSEAASKQFSEIDFLHLDGNFSEAGAYKDVQLYLPKVKPGGYILVSNAMVVIDKKTPKVRSLWTIYDSSDIIKEVDNGNTVLFRKFSN
ncbi:MAG: class I SAM-dependent methyltransferase [Simkaniaceae bacterium]|nr:class I SAM-dependent methyltransferase [Simkaniaceae bacterium]